MTHDSVMTGNKRAMKKDKFAFGFKKQNTADIQTATNTHLPVLSLQRNRKGKGNIAFI